MKQEEFKTDKPNTQWRCSVCRNEKESLEIFAETETETCLICAECFQKNAREVALGLNDF